jgi:GH15 family glucan-1,4-alpha-glucosidase
MTLTASRSVELLVAAQTRWGSIPASTEHKVYQFGWLRDGSWCAYALDVAGHHEQAQAWHQWVARTLLEHEARFDEACEAVRTDAVTGAVMMPARFTLDGHEEVPDADGEDEWPNFQTDCYGFWLWALADHVTRGGLIDDTLAAAADLVVRCLLVAGRTACYDCWEEHPGNVHTSSLAAVAAGLRDAGRMLGNPDAIAAAEQVTTRITGPEHPRRRIAPRTAAGPCAVALHVGVLAGEVGPDRHAAAVVPRDARCARRRDPQRSRWVILG